MARSTREVSSARATATDYDNIASVRSIAPTIAKYDDLESVELPQFQE
jgi:hypothetical protein